MPFKRRQVLNSLALLCAAGLSAAMPLTASAQSWPNRPIKLVVPFPAGGAADLMARTMAQQMEAQLKQAVVIDNRGGAGGAVGAEAVAKAPPDGYTLFFGTMGTHAINPALYSKLRYDPIKDFTPIALTHITPRALLASNALKARNVAELIAQAKANPGSITYGSVGIGSSSHLAGALFESMAGIKMLHVPYKGSSQLILDVMSARVDLTFDTYITYEDHVKSGKVRTLAVTTAQRMDALPNVPTLDESGLKGYEVSLWLGVYAPANTPAEIVKPLNAAIGRAMATPELVQNMTKQGIETTFSTPEAFATLTRNDVKKWAEIVKQSGATAE